MRLFLIALLFAISYAQTVPDEATTTPPQWSPYGVAMCLPELPYAVPGSNGRGEGICCSDPLKKNKCPKNSAIGYCFHDPSTLDQGWSTGTGAECVDYQRITDDDLPQSSPGCPASAPRWDDSCSGDLDCHYGPVICCCDSCKRRQLTSCTLNGDWISLWDNSCDWADDECEVRECEQDECGVYCGPGAGPCGCEKCDTIDKGMLKNIMKKVPKTFAQIGKKLRKIAQSMRGEFNRRDFRQIDMDMVNEIIYQVDIDLMAAVDVADRFREFYDENGRPLDGTFKEAPENPRDCPRRPPRVSARCDDSDLDCNYGDIVCCCDECRKVQLMSCTDSGRWISFMDTGCNNGCEPEMQPTDPLNRGKMKQLFSWTGHSRKKGLKAKLNRDMEEILNENLSLRPSTLSLISQLATATDSRDTSFTEWLPIAIALNEELSQDYESNGDPIF